MGRHLNIAICLVLLVAGIFVGVLIMNNVNPVPDGKVIVNQSAVDSLKAYIHLADSLQIIANEPPDTVKVDSIIYSTETVYVETTPEADPLDEETNIYSDSLIVDGEINAWVKFKVHGFVEGNLQWRYNSIVKEVTTTVEKKIPYPVIETIEVDKFVTGHYLSAVAGGNANLFTFGIDYDLVKQNNIYGFQYRRQGNQNIYGVKVGVSLTALFKKNR